MIKCKTLMLRRRQGEGGRERRREEEGEREREKVFSTAPVTAVEKASVFHSDTKAGSSEPA